VSLDSGGNVMRFDSRRLHPFAAKGSVEKDHGRPTVDRRLAQPVEEASRPVAGLAGNVATFCPRILNSASTHCGACGRKCNRGDHRK